MAWKWETRGNGEYLYTAFRINGRVVKSYLSKNGPLRSAINVLMRDRQERDREEREERCRQSAELRERVKGVLRELVEAKAELWDAAEAELASVGFHNHYRGNGEWLARQARTRTLRRTVHPTPPPLRRQTRPYHGTPPSAPPPLIEYHPLKGWLDGADELFAAACAGDGNAQARLRKALRADEHVRDHFGDIGNRATKTIVARIGGGDAVLAISIEEKVRAMT